MHALTLCKKKTQMNSASQEVSFLPCGRDKWEVRVSGETWREVHRTIFGAKPCFPTLLNVGEIQVVFDEYEYKRVKNYTLWRLSKQSYHSEQLAKLLRERLVQDKTSKRVIADLQTAGFLDDDAWLQAYVQSQQKKYGLSLILAKLRAKGLSGQTLRQFAEEKQESGDEVQVIRRLLQTKYRLKDLTDYKMRQKVFTALIRKGFSFDHVKDALQARD